MRKRVSQQAKFAKEAKRIMTQKIESVLEEYSRIHYRLGKTDIAVTDIVGNDLSKLRDKTLNRYLVRNRALAIVDQISDGGSTFIVLGCGPDWDRHVVYEDDKDATMLANLLLNDGDGNPNSESWDMHEEELKAHIRSKIQTLPITIVIDNVNTDEDWRCCDYKVFSGDPSNNEELKFPNIASWSFIPVITDVTDTLIDHDRFLDISDDQKEDHENESARIYAFLLAPL